jgi:hypothetical protein
MRVKVLLLTTILAMAAAVAFAQDAAPAVSVSPDAAPAVSLDRVRTALQRPPTHVTFEERKPDFSVEVVWHHPFHEIFDVPPWQLPKVGWQPPAYGINLLSIFQSMSKAAADLKRDHDERAAHEDVLRALADFCAAQADNGARVAGCASVPTIR